MELLIVNGVRAIDSRDVALLTGKRHADVIKDIESMIIKIGAERILASGYFDKNNQERKCYKLPYRETLILLSGYSVELRARVIDRWLYLEKRQKTIREESKITRNRFTDMLKEHGYTKQIHYIQTTKQMKSMLGITAKKDAMTEGELKKVRAAEALADLFITDQIGYHEVNPVCINISLSIAHKSLDMLSLK